MKRSVGLFVQTFGRTLLTNLYVTLIALGLGFLGVVLLIAGLWVALATGSVVLGVLLVIAALAVWIFTAVLVVALEGILRAALYRYATTGILRADVVPYEYRVPR